MKLNIFRKLVLGFLLTILLGLNTSTIVLAQSTPAGVTDVANPTENDLFYQFKYQDVKNNQGNSVDVTSQTKIGAVNNLPNATWQQTLTSIIKTLLNISGGLTLLGLTVGGVFMVIANGATDSIEKGKKIVIYSIVGLLVIAISYAIVVGVSELQFFTPSTANPANGGTSSNTVPAGSTPVNDAKSTEQ